MYSNDVIYGVSSHMIIREMRMHVHAAVRCLVDPVHARVVKRKSNMALVKVSVYCITSKMTLLSWRIISSDDPDTTFRALFRETSKMTLLSWRIISSDDPDTTFRALFRERLKPTIGHECELEKVYVGRDKVCLDEADMNLNVSQVQ